MCSKLNIIFLGVVALALTVKAVTDEDKSKIVELLMPAINDCSEEYPLKDGELMDVIESGKFTSLNSCFIGCVLQKNEMIDSENMMNAEKILEIAKQDLSSADDLAKVSEVLETCASVNEQAVSDTESEKLCDRAKFLVECFDPYRELFFP